MTDDGGLRIGEDSGFQRREWIAERVGWLLIVAIIAAAALGFFANGRLAQRTATSDDGSLRLQYQRFARDQGTAELQVRAARETADLGVVQLWIRNAYLDAILIEQVVPEPESWVSTRGGAVLRFQAEGDAPFEAAFTLHPDEVGLHHGEMALGDAPPIRFTQLFYP